MVKIDITRTELIWPGKYNDDGTLKEVARVSLPFQVIETVNESRATREARKLPQQTTLFDIYEGTEGDSFQAGWRNKLIWGGNGVAAGKVRGKDRPIYIDPPFATGSWSAGRWLARLLAEGERDGFYQAQLIRELAVRHITSWTGVELTGGRAPPTPENVAAVMELYPVGERFFQEFTLRQVLLNAAKNGSGLSPVGTSSRAEGPSTAGAAATTACPAPEANQEPTVALP